LPAFTLVLQRTLQLSKGNPRTSRTKWSTRNYPFWRKILLN